MWKTSKLKDICRVFTDGNWIESKDQSVEGIRLVQTGNVKTGSFAGREDKARYISEETFKRLKCTEVIEGDILVSRLPEPVGRACVIPKLQEKAITAVDCTIIRTNEDVSPRYLNYYMQSPQYFSLVQEKVTGATRQRISRKNLGEVLVSIPPLAEQQRIVAKLDAAFAEIDRFQFVIEKQLSEFDSVRLKTYQAIINKHCSKQSRRKLSELVDESCSLSYGIVQPGEEVAQGLPVVRPVDLKSKWIGEKDLKRIAHERAESYQRTKLTGGEILLCVRGSTGVVSLADDALIGANVTRGIIPIRFADGVSNEYGYYALQSEQAQKQIAAKTYGATLQQINVKDVKNLVIDVPRIEEQLKAVDEIAEADDYLNALKCATQGKLENANQLKSSILAQELQPPQSEAA